MVSNDRAGVTLAQPTKDEERVRAAQTCSQHLELSMPLVVDTIDDRVGRLYSGMPDRLYVIDRNGKVSYKSGRGPFGFKPGEMEQELILMLLGDAPEAKNPQSSKPRAAQPEVAPRPSKITNQAKSRSNDAGK